MKLKPDHPAVLESRTIHPKMVKDANRRLLKPATDNQKLGKGHKVIQKGSLKGFPMYSLTLEERKTCPNTCLNWLQCYGNNMGFAHRIDHTDKDFLFNLEKEIRELNEKGPFLVRLHVLGDFYSTPYIRFWYRVLGAYSNLHVFGYTALWNCSHSVMLRAIRRSYGKRFMVRYSRPKPEISDANDLFAAKAEQSSDGIVCPQQTGKTQSCLTCSLCWETDKTILFVEH